MDDSRDLEDVKIEGFNENAFLEPSGIEIFPFLILLVGIAVILLSSFLFPKQFIKYASYSLPLYEGDRKAKSVHLNDVKLNEGLLVFGLSLTGAEKTNLNNNMAINYSVDTGNNEYLGEIKNVYFQDNISQETVSFWSDKVRVGKDTSNLMFKFFLSDNNVRGTVFINCFKYNKECRSFELFTCITFILSLVITIILYIRNMNSTNKTKREQMTLSYLFISLLNIACLLSDLCLSFSEASLIIMKLAIISSDAFFTFMSVSTFLSDSVEKTDKTPIFFAIAEFLFSLFRNFSQKTFITFIISIAMIAIISVSVIIYFACNSGVQSANFLILYFIYNTVEIISIIITRMPANKLTSIDFLTCTMPFVFAVVNAHLQWPKSDEL